MTPVFSDINGQFPGSDKKIHPYQEAISGSSQIKEHVAANVYMKTLKP